MKRVVTIFIVLLLIASVSIAGYMLILRSDTSTETSEEEGLEAIRPRNMRITDVQADSFTIEWEVRSSVSGYVKYGNTSNALTLIEQDVNGVEPAKQHVVHVTGLQPSRKYYVWVMSDNTAFGINGRALEVLTFAH